MKERPILFRAPMVRAILDGRKTMTRRVVDAKWQGFKNVMPLPAVVEIAAGGTMDFPGARPGDQLFYTDMPLRDGAWQPVGCPYGHPGDRLWVRETFANISKKGFPPEIYYRADAEYAEDYDSSEWKWRPSIFMPREASRIMLEITDVRVERVQDISEEDAKAEGVESAFDIPKSHYEIKNVFSNAFSQLWDSINAKRGYGWDANPLVWVLEFKRIKP